MPDAEYMRNYRKTNPDYVRGMALKRRYGIDLAEYDRMRRAQDYRCAICRRKESELPAAGRPPKDPDAPRIRLVVDHCHRTGSVRKLLCSPCNVVLGALRDDPAVLEAAKVYLSEHTGEPTAAPQAKPAWQPYPDDF